MAAVAMTLPASEVREVKRPQQSDRPYAALVSTRASKADLVDQTAQKQANSATRSPISTRSTRTPSSPPSPPSTRGAGRKKKAKVPPIKAKRVPGSSKEGVGTTNHSTASLTPVSSLSTLDEVDEVSNEDDTSPGATGFDETEWAPANSDGRERVIYRRAVRPDMLGSHFIPNPYLEADDPLSGSRIVVKRVEPGSAGAAYGVKVGDMISEFNGESLACMSAQDAESHIYSSWLQMSVGAALTLTLSQETRDVILIGRPPKPLGVRLAEIRAPTTVGELAYHLPPFGVVVLRVEDESIAARAGLKEGDIICSVNGKLATHPKHVTQEMTAQRCVCGVATVVVAERRACTDGGWYTQDGTENGAIHPTAGLLPVDLKYK